MSPIVGLLIAVVAGLLAVRPRLAAAVVVPPMIGATAAQSWYLGTGRGHNPASTTTGSVGYWIVQLLIITAVCGLAATVCWVRVRRSVGQPAAVSSGSPLVAILIGAAVASGATTLGLMFLTDRPTHPGSGNGQIPVAGAIAVVVGLLVLAALAVDWLRRTRQLRQASSQLAR
jgi:hypothetical protein